MTSSYKVREIYNIIYISFFFDKKKDPRKYNIYSTCVILSFCDDGKFIGFKMSTYYIILVTFYVAKSKMEQLNINYCVATTSIRGWMLETVAPKV